MSQQLVAHSVIPSPRSESEPENTNRQAIYNNPFDTHDQNANGDGIGNAFCCGAGCVRRCAGMLNIVVVLYVYMCYDYEWWLCGACACSCYI